MEIGFIGLGAMGRPMALSLMRAGHRLTVHDTDRDGPGARELPRAGARWADTPKAAAAGAEIIFTSLPGPPEVESVALGKDGILEGAAKGSVYVDLSTNSPTLMRKIHRIFREHGVHVLDAPVSEGVDRARYEGTLTIMVGGERAVFERVKAVLNAIGRDRLLYVGESGSGSICKIVNNLVVYAAHASLAEALALGRLAGVPLDVLAGVICQSSGQSRVADDFRNSLSEQQSVESTTGFPLWIGRKDVRLATDLGRELDVPMAIANHVDQAFSEWMARGWKSKSIDVHMMIEEMLSRLAKT